MTENEAIKQIRKQICNEKGVQRYCRDNCMHGIEHCAYSIAIQALEEIQQYRAIGTVEEFKALKEDKKFLEFLYNQILPNEMEQYLSMYRMKDKVVVNGYADQSGLMPAT